MYDTRQLGRVLLLFAGIPVQRLLNTGKLIAHLYLSHCKAKLKWDKSEYTCVHMGELWEIKKKKKRILFQNNLGNPEEEVTLPLHTNCHQYYWFAVYGLSQVSMAN